MKKRIAIIGAGPAGCALACFLAERDIECIVFDDEKKPGLLVGESLVPAVIPLLRRLGIEKEVAQISSLKRGAALRHANGTRVDFRFRRFGSKFPNHSYNVPRPEFDRILLKRAEESGVKFINQRAKLEIPDTKVDSQRDIQLSSASLAQAELTRDTQPQLIVDATGRSRLISRLLKIPAKKGGRDDVSYFAHYEQFDSDAILEGQVVQSVLDCGWSWQIPLKNALSVGVVLDKHVAKSYGASPEERLEYAIDNNPMLSKSGAGRKRVSKVMSYSNYQLITEQGSGKGWVLLGDAFGFVDPLLSPGLFMALKSAEFLDDLVFSKAEYLEQPQLQDRLRLYCNETYAWHESWDSLIQYFYDGRLLSLAMVKEHILKNNGLFSLARLLEPHISKILSSMVSGVKTRSKYNHSMLLHSCQHLLSDTDNISEYAIKSTGTLTSSPSIISNNTKTAKQEQQAATMT
ncbi:MAG: NAD(P)/FAD-dependent oxidoreductase [Arenicella sp.]